MAVGQLALVKVGANPQPLIVSADEMIGA